MPSHPLVMLPCQAEQGLTARKNQFLQKHVFGWLNCWCLMQKQGHFQFLRTAMRELKWLNNGVQHLFYQSQNQSTCFNSHQNRKKSLDQLVVRGTHKQKEKYMYILFFFSSLKPKLPLKQDLSLSQQTKCIFLGNLPILLLCFSCLFLEYSLPMAKMCKGFTPWVPNSRIRCFSWSPHGVVLPIRPQSCTWSCSTTMECERFLKPIWRIATVYRLIWRIRPIGCFKSFRHLPKHALQLLRSVNLILQHNIFINKVNSCAPPNVPHFKTFMLGPLIKSPIILCRCESSPMCKQIQKFPLLIQK